MLAVVLACAAIFFVARQRGGGGEGRKRAVPHGFVAVEDGRFVVDGEPFRFAGMNAAITYGDEERRRMPEILAAAARDGMSVVRVWAFGETSEPGAHPRGTSPHDWLYQHPFRRGSEGWNEEAFVHLDRILAEAARLRMRVQICFTNWWPDTGGVTQYLVWAGIQDAYDPAHPFGVNVERATLFYTDERARHFYRRHIERIVTRRNTITGTLYRDDPTIFGYELMNEAQAPAGRWAERRRWVAEMSAYTKSLDPHHLVTPGTWGYRFSWERREWLAEHALAEIDFCDVHLYPRDDTDSHVNSFEALGQFIDNRAAAAWSLRKPLVFGEFGIPAEGFQGRSQAEWFRAYFAATAERGAGGAMFWVWTEDEARDYGLSPFAERDRETRAAIAQGARLLQQGARDGVPARLRDAGRYLVPNQFDLEATTATTPVVKQLDEGALLYRFSPEQATRGRFEKLGRGADYVWGSGAGFFEYAVPAREEWRRVGEIVVRAHLQPTPPHDAQGRIRATRVTLFIDGTDCGSRLVEIEPPREAFIQEWRVRSLWPRLAAARGRPLNIRFAVEPEADQPFGLNISNFPEGYDPGGATPVEVEVK